MLAALSAAYLFAGAQTTPQTSMGVFENLKLPRLLGLIPSTQGPAKVWTGKLESLRSDQALAFQQVGEVQVTVTDFSSIKPTPTPDQILANYERSLLGNKMLAGAHFRKTHCTFGDKKVIVFDGTAVIATPERVSPMNVIAFAFIDSTQLYQFQALTLRQEKYEELLATLDGMELSGKKVTGWPSTTAGTFSIAGSPFSVKAPNALFPVLGEPIDESLESQYIGAVYVPKGAHYRYVLARLKEGDSRGDDEILAILTRAAISVEVPKGFKVDSKTRKGQFTFKRGPVNCEAEVEFRRKGNLAAVVAASRVPYGAPFGGVELVEAKQP
jgi:hypothetical protein